MYRNFAGYLQKHFVVFAVVDVVDVLVESFVAERRTQRTKESFGVAFLVKRNVQDMVSMRL